MPFSCIGWCKRSKQEGNIKDKDKQEWPYSVANIEDRRVKILGAMLNNNMEKVCNLLTKAIEEAFEKEKGNATK